MRRCHDANALDDKRPDDAFYRVEDVPPNNWSRNKRDFLLKKITLALLFWTNFGERKNVGCDSSTTITMLAHGRHYGLRKSQMAGSLFASSRDPSLETY